MPPLPPPAVLPGYDWRLWLLLGSGLALVTITGLLPPLAQPEAYHRFADQGFWLGVPNGLNVLSNLPFLLVGAWGLARLPVDLEARFAWRVFFFGVFCTAFGSGYYHWLPDNPGLAWDRLPMSVAFMALLAALLGERLDAQWGNRLLWPLLLAGPASVLWWIHTESQGAGDLRWYLLVQFYPLGALILLLLAYPARYTHASHYWGLLGCYVLAKALELLDLQIYAWSGELVGGHPFKHLMAALGIFWLLSMLIRRRPLLSHQMPQHTA